MAKEEAVSSSARMIDSKLSEWFSYSAAELKEVSDGVLTSMNQGLATHGSLLQMLSTYIFSLPNGREKGRFWAVDIGGTNLRIMCIDMHPGRDPQVNLFKCKVSESVMTSTEEELFGSIADLIKTHLESMGVTMGGEKMPTGFTFSFPVRQTGLTSGTLVKWAKGFNALGCVGKDVVSMMQTQFDSRGVPLRIDALVNDTIGTLVASSLQHGPACKVGLIIGTGYNSCYIEKAEALQSKDPVPEEFRSGFTIVNTECGNYSGHGLKVNPQDVEVDETSPNPGHQRLEKLISGMYLGPIVHNTLVKLQRDGLWLSQSGSSSSGSGAKLSTADMAEIQKLGGESGEFDEAAADTVRRILVENGGFLGAESASAEELRTVFKVVDAVGLRSSRLASVTIVSLLRRMRENGVVGPKERVTIAVDGTVFREYPRYQTRLNEGLRQLLGELTLDNEVNVVTACDEGSGVGAATVVACLQTSAAGG